MQRFIRELLYHLKNITTGIAFVLVHRHSFEKPRYRNLSPSIADLVRKREALTVGQFRRLIDMRIRAGFLTLLMVSVMAVFQNHHLCGTALGRSTETFFRYFCGLRDASLNPVERFVFSLMLANTKPQRETGTGRRGA
jgi:hypothetical protein